MSITESARNTATVRPMRISSVSVLYFIRIASCMVLSAFLASCKYNVGSPVGESRQHNYPAANESYGFIFSFDAPSYDYDSLGFFSLTVAGASRTDGKSGKCLAMSPTSNVECTSIEYYYQEFVDSFSIAFWIYPDTLRKTTGLLTAQPEYYNTDQNPFSMIIADSGRIGILLSAPNSYSLEPERLNIDSTGITAKQWTHLALTYNGEYFLVYIGGVLTARVNYITRFNHFSSLVLGYSSTFPFTGKIDEFYMRYRIFTEAEIRNLAER